MEKTKTNLQSTDHEDLELFEKIKLNPHPEITDLWSLSQESFIEWRKLHDYPRLLNHFDNTFKFFKEWKAEYGLTNEIIIRTGYISVFLEKKYYSKNKNLYLSKLQNEQKEIWVVLDDKKEGEIKDMGETFNYTCEQIFKSYLDWLDSKKETQIILNIIKRIKPMKGGWEKIYLGVNPYKEESHFELLNMGGISLPKTNINLLWRAKTLEFVNLSYLQLNGEYWTGSHGILSCTYCVCDNWQGKEFTLPFIFFKHCTISDINFQKFTLQQWTFFDCIVSGELTDSAFNSTQIIGGNFSPYLKNCSLYRTDIRKIPKTIDNNSEGYRIFKKIYQNQGDDEISKEYYIKEKESRRKKMKGLKFIGQTIDYLYWEYGKSPGRIVIVSILIILIWGVVYWFWRDLILASGIKISSLLDAFYFSTTTFTTLGYGDYSPIGWLRIMTSIEAFCGMVNTGFIIAGYASNRY